VLYVTVITKHENIFNIEVDKLPLHVCTCLLNSLKLSEQKGHCRLGLVDLLPLDGPATLGGPATLDGPATLEGLALSSILS